MANKYLVYDSRTKKYVGSKPFPRGKAEDLVAKAPEFLSMEIAGKGIGYTPTPKVKAIYNAQEKEDVDYAEADETREESEHHFTEQDDETRYQ